MSYAKTLRRTPQELEQRKEAKAVRRATISWLLLLVTTLPWGTVLIGPGQGPAAESPRVTALKLATSLLAVALAFSARRPMPLPGALKLLLGLAAAAALGSQLSGPDPTGGTLRAARYAAVVLAVSWAVSRLGLPRGLKLLAAFASIEAGLALGARFTGLQPPVDGRLAGYLPPLHPNALALTLAAGFIALVILWMSRDVRGRTVLLGMVLLGTALLLTGSRSSLLAVGAALVASLLTRPRPARSVERSTGRPGRVFIMGYLICFLLAVAAVFEVNSSLKPYTWLATRGGGAVFDRTFTGRTVAWDSAWQAQETDTERLFGQGLTVKSVPVSNPYIDFQLVDGSWPAAYLQAGLVGITALSVAVLVALVSCLRRPARLCLPLLTLVIVAGVAESQLNDVALGLALFAAATTWARALNAPQEDADTVVVPEIADARPNTGALRVNAARVPHGGARSRSTR